jgi:EmrB/QacA subfamily drug resistance transporter
LKQSARKKGATPAAASPIASGGVQLSRRQTFLLVTSLMLATALAALDSLIVGTAMPTIVGSLGGISLYAWLVAAYLITSTTTVPLFGRLADMYGRKPVYVFGIVAFVLGSVLCGLAGTMTQLIVFRAIQGLGAGAVGPVAMTIVGDVFSIEERAKMQGLFSAVWGISSVLGPPLGALIVSVLSWHWVFFVNVPIGIVALGLVLVVYHERVARHAQTIDYLGVGLLIAGVTGLLFALQSTGQNGAISAGALALAYVGSLALLGLFVWRETRQPHPLFPLALLRRPIIGVGYLVGLLAGLTQFGVGTYVPLFVQGPLGGTAATVGLVTAPMSIGWPIGAIVSGKLIMRFGYRGVLLAGMVATLVGSAGLLLVGRVSPVWAFSALVGIVGLGMGLSSTPTLIALQGAVGWSQRGVATALNQFFRTIGGAVGVAAMGAVLNAGVDGRLAGAPALAGLPSPHSLLNVLLDPVARGGLGGPVVEALRAALEASLHDVFLLSAGAAVIGLVCAVAFFPAGGVDEHATEG